MLKFLRKRAVILVALFLLPIGGIALAAPANAAGSGIQFCMDTITFNIFCLNAWNGGPSVRQYGPNVVNDDFSITDDPNDNNAWQLEDTDGGSYQGWCIGDYGDNKGNATTGLVGCWSGKSAGGWGSNFVQESDGCPSGTFALFNLHWSGVLAPAKGGDGAEWYLNTSTVTCFYETFV